MKNKTIRFFLDDIRNPEDVYKYTKLSIYLEDWLIVRDYDSFIRAILYHGIPDTISYDHDLGVFNTPDTEKTGYDCAKWLINYCIDNKVKLPNYLVHSQNPVGASNIENLMKNYYKFESTINND